MHFHLFTHYDTVTQSTICTYLVSWLVFPHQRGDIEFRSMWLDSPPPDWKIIMELRLQTWTKSANQHQSKSQYIKTFRNAFLWFEKIFRRLKTILLLYSNCAIRVSIVNPLTCINLECRIKKVSCSHISLLSNDSAAFILFLISVKLR